MPAPVAGTHVFLDQVKQGVDARHKAGMTLNR
jgi:hypothetical protein